MFSSLVLCTVENPEQVIAEVHRVLKPGGRFACVEHVEAPAGSAIHRMQRLELSPHAPAADHDPPPAEWKRFEMFRDVLPKGDPAAAGDGP